MMADPLEKKINLDSSEIKNLKKKFFGLKLDQPKKPTGKKTRKFKYFLIGLLIFLLFLAVFLPFFLIKPLINLRSDGGKLNIEAKQVYTALQAQDLKLAITKINSTTQEVNRLEKDYRRLIWLKPLPFIGSYYRDGQYLIEAGGYLLEAADLTIKALEPYADILGLEGEEKKTPEAMTAEDRLYLALDTLDKIQPHLNEINEKLGLAKAEIDKINPQRYPEKIGKLEVREKMIFLVETVDGTIQLAAEIKPLVGFLKPLMGFPEKRTYLLLFQNDAELRPSGGFMTAYALLTIDKGKIIPGASRDIYSLDARFGNRLPAPGPIKKYLPQVYNWHLRDMNLSPDFTKSMDTFWENAQKVIGTSQIDGFIAVDTKVLVDIMEVLGPIGVTGFGNFSAEIDNRCDCPQVFYELERYADKPVSEIKEERKGIIGPLMNSILLNAMGSPRKKWPQFFNVTFKNIQEKHILFYFFEENIQKSIEALNASGRIKDFQGDYFHLNDCNFAGAKSNMFIEQEVNQEIEIGADGTVTKTVTIDYRNPAPPSDCNLETGELCLNGLYRNWFRLYVPAGSELLESNGSEVEIKIYEELGKTVFEGFYGDKAPLRPQGKAQVSFKYKLPFKINKGEILKLLVQKQPGTKNNSYQIRVNGQEESFELSADRELQFKI